MKLRNFAYGASAMALLLSVGTAVHAQETTGGISGSVVDANGQAVAGATVTVTHLPSRTSSTTITAPNGNFGARNLRVGGPYLVEVSSSEGSTSQEVPAIGIGAPYLVSLTLDATDATSLDDIIVTGARVARNTSPTSNIGLSELETLPSISRDVRDFVRTTPFATVDPSNSGALSIGGQNTRYNAFLVDGVRQGDDFGLNSNGYPTVGTPVSLSVIEAVSVSVSPYDVQYGSFTGGVVNSVTKSGGNDFHGELFYEFTNEGLQGNTFAYDNFQTGVPTVRTVSGQFQETTWGATLSGPIIQDRLFFLVNYEKFESTQPVLTGPTGSTAVNPIPGITQADVDAVRAAVQTAYGYDPLNWQADALEVMDEKIFAKVDWNINDQHRAVFSYQNTESSDFRVGSSSNNSGTPILALLSSAYTLTQVLDSYKAQLFSDWSDNLSTELSVAYKSVDSITSNFVDNDTAQFLVYLDNPMGTGTRRAIRLGPDVSRHANELTTETTLYRAVANYQFGDNRFTFGFEREEQEIFNLFVQNANGTYEFASLLDLANRQASAVTYANAASGIKSDAGAAFGYAMNSLFFQNTWRGDDLTVTMGLRADWYEGSDRPARNAAFETRYGFRNDHTLDGITVIQPRLGFNWRASDDLTVYGGVGLYQGGSPTVWVSNAFSNDGFVGSLRCRVSAAYSSPNTSGSGSSAVPVCPAGTTLSGVNATNPSADLDALVAGLPGDITPIDPNFRTPSIWKTSLGATYDFDLDRFGMGDNWRLTAEYVHSAQNHAVGWIDLSMQQTRLGVAPDGRPVFGPNPVNAAQRVLLLTNAPGGETDQFAVAISKDWRDGLLEGLGFNLSYTWLDAEEATSPGSSTAWSSYQNVTGTDPNDFIVDTSAFEIKHALKLNLSYSRAFFGDYRTRANLFGQRRSGLPFSYVYNSQTTMFGYNGGYTTRNALLYVPRVDPTSGLVTTTSDPLVRYAASFTPTMLTDFNNFLKNTGLIEYAGQVAPRNGFRAPDVTTFDLHLAQELPAFFPGGARLEAYMDIENLGNLLNDEWGVIQQYNSPYSSSANINATVNCMSAPANCAAGNAANYYTYQSYVTASPQFTIGASVWQIKFGVRYSF